MRGPMLPVAVLGTLVLSAVPGQAFVTMTGSFEASRSCPVSVRIDGTPNGRVEAGKRYRLLGRNRQEATHYRIEIGPGHNGQRWVSASCGKPVVQGAGVNTRRPASPARKPELDRKPGRAGKPAPVGPAGTPGPSGRFTLAVSWQPAFCETRPSTRECRTMTGQRFDATHFTLHGLWPQPRGNDYCNVPYNIRRIDGRSGSWRSLPPLRLTPETRRQLDRAMPGTMSYLHRHEWVRHGTCYGAPAERYYRDSLSLLAELNRSSVRTLFDGSIGRRVRIEQIRRAFDESFGRGAGRRVDIRCVNDGGRRIVLELRLNLAGRVGPGPSLGRMLRAARPLRSRCAGGIVDPVGLQ